MIVCLVLSLVFLILTIGLLYMEQLPLAGITGVLCFIFSCISCIYIGYNLKEQEILHKEQKKEQECLVKELKLTPEQIEIIKRG